MGRLGKDIRKAWPHGLGNGPHGLGNEKKYTYLLFFYTNTKLILQNLTEFIGQMCQMCQKNVFVVKNIYCIQNYYK